MPIRKIKARQIFDCCGTPTVEIDLITDIGLLRSSVPSVQFSNGREAKEIRDDDANSYDGKSVFKVVDTINNVLALEVIKSKLEVHQQREIDLLLKTLDGTRDKSKHGANALLAISVACCKAAAAKRGLPVYRYIAMLCDNKSIKIPVPSFNMISGGRASGNDLIYQEFLILPTGVQNFAEAMQAGLQIYHKLQMQLAESSDVPLPLPVANDGTLVAEFDDDVEALQKINEAVVAAGYDDKKVRIGLDFAASALYVDGMYNPEFKNTEDEANPEDFLDSEAMVEIVSDLLNQCPFVHCIEDPLDPDDIENWKVLKENFPDKHFVVDEFDATNEQAMEDLLTSDDRYCLSLRLGKFGTVSEALECAKKAKEAGWQLSISAGQGETEDNFVTDFAVGVGASIFKAGAPCRGERISKYNHLLRIEEELGKEAIYVGVDVDKNDEHNKE